MSRENRPGGTRPDANVTKSDGAFTESRSCRTSSVGGDINMDGTRYCLLSLDDGQGEIKLNLSMTAMRLL